MEQSRFQNQSGNTYIFDSESATEMARLLDQDKLLTYQVLGSLFPARIDTSGIFDVLDIACGPGGWVHEVARTYPKMDVVGIDISRRMIAYARAHAQVLKLPNARFLSMDILKTLEFPDASFDLVHARVIAAVMNPSTWSRLLAECKRILRPGGIICWIEAEAGPINQPAIDTLFSLIFQALKRSGRGYSPAGRNPGIHAMMGRLLRDAGFQNIQSKADILDFSFDTPDHESSCQSTMMMFKQAQPFLLQMKVATQEELEALYEQAMEEVNSEDFCAISYFRTCWGYKPEEK
jgi:ubiquinone/menaquinone biosynthesis C-methylase UbiE